MWLLKFKWHRWRRSSKTYGTQFRLRQVENHTVNCQSEFISNWAMAWAPIAVLIAIDMILFGFVSFSPPAILLIYFHFGKIKIGYMRDTQRERDGDKSLSHFLSICFQQLQTFPLSSHPLLPKKNQQHDSEQTWQWKKKKKQKIKLKKNIQVKWIKNV